MSKRPGAVTFKTNPVTLVGPELKPGDAAPDFQAVTQTLSIVGINDTPAKARLFSVVPSIDTPVCSAQTKRFADGVAALGERVAAYTVSLDLPFAQKRFCGAENLTTMQTLSDVRNHSFGTAFGVLIEGLPLPLLARAVFVVDSTGAITHVEYVSEVTAHPDYDQALAALTAAAK